MSADRPTCRGAYPNGGITETLTKWLRYIACEGQVNMARIGYSPLPPNLSQEVANSIARLTGQAPEQLTQANCANPRFGGSVGDGGAPPVDPIKNLDAIGGEAAAGGSGVAAAGAGGATTGKGGTTSSGGGSTDWRRATPVAYVGPSIASSNGVAVLFLLLVMAVPVIVGAILARRRRSHSTPV